MENVLLWVVLMIVSLAFLAVIAVLGVVAIVHGQGDIAQSTLDILREWVNSVWKK
jgi:hypothetical protein